MDRRQVEKLRQARRPSVGYSSNVNRRIRGKWFSLVPVRRRAMACWSVVVLTVAMLLCLGHWAAAAWQPLAYRPEIARPFRLDRPDSFGTWVQAVFLAAASGTSFLIYQLRRYRNDDFRGSYRIWPPVIVLIALASLNSVCGLIPWLGELIDFVFGKRVALTGGDWLRIGLTIGGAALSLRLLAEVRHSKLAFGMLLISITCFALPLMARWGLVQVETPFRWLTVTSAPMLASATLWIACGAYLRKLFREVRRIDDDVLVSLRLKQWRDRILVGKKTGISPESPPARRTENRFSWFSSRRKRQASPQKVETNKAKKAATEKKQSDAQVSTGSEDKPGKSATRNKNWPLGWLRSRSSKSSTSPKANGADRPQPDSPSEVKPPEIDGDSKVSGDRSIDWASMSKAERRRARRELKRDTHAS